MLSSVGPYQQAYNLAPPSNSLANGFAAATVTDAERRQQATVTQSVGPSDQPVGKAVVANKDSDQTQTAANGNQQLNKDGPRGTRVNILA